MDKPNDNSQQVTPAEALPPAASGISAADSSTAPDAAPPAPLTLRQWLSQNGPILVLLLIGLAWLYRNFGIDGPIRGAYVAIGLGFVIFIHEMGHFLAAKFCDVHVTAFSLGFGPALPGCQFTRGETTYKIAMLPLGGYVAMVGEGTEADEDEDYPRSFKNKPVWQRMIIISAGVIMNVLFGLVCLIAVYRYQGVDRQAAVISRTDAGSVAWHQGVRPGWKITKIDSKSDPFFDDLRFAVALSTASQPVEFQFTDAAKTVHNLSMIPLRDGNNSMPAIGVAPSERLTLRTAKYRKVAGLPVVIESAAARARVLPLGPLDKVVGLSWDSLAARFADSTDPITLDVIREGGRKEKLEVPAEGFQFGDEIIGMTNPKNPDSPFDVKPLRLDDDKGRRHDPRDFHERQVALAGKPVVYQVRRLIGKGEEKDESTALVFVPPMFTRDLGLRMKMGKVAAVRAGSSAEKAGLVAGDVISAAGLQYDGGKIEWIPADRFDPVRLPDELYRRIHADPARPPAQFRVVLKALGPVNHDAQAVRELKPMEWDDTWLPGDEAPIAAASPMSIPQLGIAYWVESTVATVVKGSPAEATGLKVGDQIVKWRVEMVGALPGSRTWTNWMALASKRDKEPAVYDRWASLFDSLQATDIPKVEFMIRRDGTDLSDAVGPIVAVPDRTWPRADPGLLLMPDTRKQKADTLAEAAWMGVESTFSFIKQIYLNLRSMFTGRISTDSLGGPIMIAQMAFTSAGMDWLDFAMFLGIISINLAVVNFLPIPILDGGHMVFLLYEAARGKRPSETVQNVATIIGLVLILSLMVFVFYNDFRRMFGW